MYQYKDQINNVRLSYSDLDGDGSIDPSTEILHERNYYPFGLLHKGYKRVINGTVNNRHQYQDQEFTEDLGLNVHEWKFRFSDPAIGRFWSIDPLAEQYSYQSPYNFSENRVIDAFELEGLEKISIHTQSFAPFDHFGFVTRWRGFAIRDLTPISLGATGEARTNHIPLKVLREGSPRSKIRSVGLSKVANRDLKTRHHKL